MIIPFVRVPLEDELRLRVLLLRLGERRVLGVIKHVHVSCAIPKTTMVREMKSSSKKWKRKTGETKAARNGKLKKQKFKNLPVIVLVARVMGEVGQ